MLIGDIGDVRSGKTLLLTKFATNLANIPENKDKGFQVFSNFHIFDKRVKFITVNDFVDLHLNELNMGLVVLQEFYAWLYGRLGNAEINRGIRPIIFQSGKLGFDIMWDSQLASSLDNSVRLLTEHFWVARPKVWKREVKFHPTLIAFRYVYSGSRVLIRYTFPLKIFDKKEKKIIPLAERYFDLYDTREQTQMLYQGRGTTLQTISPSANQQSVSLPNGAKITPDPMTIISKTAEFSRDLNSPESPFGSSKEGQRISEAQQQINELTQEQKDKLNIEDGFNTKQPLTKVSRYPELPLLPGVIDRLAANGKMKEMQLGD